MTNIYHCAW